MAEKNAICHVLFYSSDMEWNNAFSQGVQRFYALESETVNTLFELDEQISKRPIDIIVLGMNEDIASLKSIKESVAKSNQNISILAIAKPDQPFDNYIKLGASVVVNRSDILSAIRYMQLVMQMRLTQENEMKVMLENKSIEQLYEGLYQNALDPICYLQDGLFLGANPAFLHIFGIEKEALDEVTIMSFVPLKSEKKFKELMKNALQKSLVPAENFELETKAGEKLNLTVQIARVHYKNTDALQVQFKSSQTGGGSTLDPTTELGDASILRASIEQAQKVQEPNSLLGIWINLWVENYRETLQKDGLESAEILIKSVSDMAQKLLPSSTEMVRYYDDSLLLWIRGEKETTIKRIKNLIQQLDEHVPDDVGRMIHPYTYAGMLEIRQESDFEELITKSFRAVRALAVSKSEERVAEPTSAEISRKDERRVYIINQLIKNDVFSVLYQPICALKVDGVPRYADQVYIEQTEETSRKIGDDFDVDELDLDVLLQVADRFALGREITKLKINQIFTDFLSYNGDQKTLNFIILVMADAVEDKNFPTWFAEQTKQIGIQFSQITFEFKIDTVLNQYSNVTKMIDFLRPLGLKVAVSEIARVDEEIIEVFQRIKPNMVKLDMREIDTFEFEEEQKFMQQIKKIASEYQSMVVADHMESAAQLSHVWPFGINYIQGNGMVDPMKEMVFNFNEPLF